METLSKKYQYEDFSFPEFEDDPMFAEQPKQSRSDLQSVRNYVNSQLRNVRAARTRRRAQHVRDNIDGQITAYENILRYIKKR